MNSLLGKSGFRLLFKCHFILGLSPDGTLSYQHLRLDSSNPTSNGFTSSTHSPFDNYPTEAQPYTNTNGWPQSPRTRIKTTAFPTPTAYTNGQTSTLQNLDRGTFQVFYFKILILFQMRNIHSLIA